MVFTNETTILHAIRQCFADQIADGALEFGDDAAILSRPSADAFRVLTTDLVQEEIDFAVGLGPLESAGWRAISQNVSDLAAMGARPVGFVWSLAIPERWLERQGDWLLAFCRGARRAAAEYGISLYGGDLSSSRDRLTCSVTAWGDVLGAPLSRRGAQVGDRIIVSRPVGASHRGLEVLLRSRARLNEQANQRTAHEIAADFESFRRELPPADNDVLDAHLWPVAEIMLGPELLHHATSCMDISDGLVLDLSRLCDTSGVGALLHDWQKVSFAAAAGMQADEARRDLGSGEEYALLFTLPPDVNVDGLFPRASALCEIGEIVAEPGVWELHAKGRHQLAELGWDHFHRESS